MSQSDNARPCKRCADLERHYMSLSEDAGKACGDWAESHKREAAKLEALNLTCATQGRKLAAIERVLLVHAGGKPSLRDCSFEGALEAIRLAMLERPW